MNPYEGVAALRRAQQELDDVVVQLGGAVPDFWRGSAARGYLATRDELIDRVVAARGRLAHAEWLMAQFVVEASAP